MLHRALKDFACETLPFQRFRAKAAFYYTILMAFFLYHCFQQEVCHAVVPVTAYATTLRRPVLDVAGKIARHAKSIIRKVTKAVFQRLQLEELWHRGAASPRFTWA